MATYNLKKETKLYIVRNGLKYLIDIYPDLNFSQTFNETDVPVKTLHSQFNMFENAVITKANPANFSFTIPLILQNDFNIITDLLLDYDIGNIEASVKTADLYVESNSEIYKLEKAAIETGVFQIARNSLILLNISGSAAKLSKFIGTIPGTLQSRSSTLTYSAPTSLNVVLGGVTLENITNVSIELKNNIEWIQNDTLHNSIGIIDASGTQFPEAFVVQSRTLSGNVQQYITDENGDTVNSWKIGDDLNILVGNLGSSPILEFDIPSIVYTNRLDVQEVFIQSFDFKMNTTPADITQVIKHLH
jgi:hypothetical protein